MTGNPFMTVEEDGMDKEIQDFKPGAIGDDPDNPIGFMKPTGMVIEDGYLEWKEYSMSFDGDYVTNKVWEEFIHLVENGECDEHGNVLMQNENTEELLCPFCERE